ncbi:DUF4197 domain-containing protein [Methylibium petroleiphilum]|uniref:DUF4197 domain-containing protein n=1 Tax=Methylibium petroleiphilum (strain ATCC BAA-1232 / LMG 22953 / PM1) TaxID=420662 RepID=A2SCJ2_METPP|nr:DUF4197 domain-containing protein [Methylibium petroleiphilum]ABM93281.1 conserved hypothetical protein [Methylibium petroleiphilum PM1]
MDRREFTGQLVAGMALWICAAQARALSLSDADASAGLKAALERGAEVAVSLLGKTDGFLGNPKVRIPLPSGLDSAAKLMKSLGQGKKVDELVTAMNRAAEAAVPESKQLLSNAVKQMSVDDAKKILTGGDTSVTNFFAEKTRMPLGEKFLPIVTRQTEKVDLANKYNAVAAKASGFGLVKKADANVQQYVTGKALDGLYLMIGEEEKKIRQDPVGTGSAILKKVFGAL